MFNSFQSLTVLTDSSKTFSLRELFQNNYFYIPDYQRGYSWGVDQLTDLIRDIDNISKLDHSHYTGTIVAAKNLLTPDKYELVDGQQRLTSLIILLNCIYCKFPERFPEIKSLYILRGEVGNENLVFEPNAETKECFRQAIICNRTFNPSIKSHESILNAKGFFMDWITSNAEGIDVIYHTATTKLNFLFYTPEMDNEIGIMFEVINNRGKKLSELEKIKNYFIYYSTIHNKKTLRNNINTNWATIQTNLSRAGRTSNEDENSFLRNCYLVYFKPNKEKSWNVYNESKNEFDIKVQEPEYILASVSRMDGFVTFLASASMHYAWFFNQKFFGSSYQGDKKEEIGKHLTNLLCQPVNASIMPLYLAVMDRLDHPEKVLDLLGLIERVNMRLYVLPDIFRRADSKQGDLFQFANEFYHDREWRSEEASPSFTAYNNVLIKGDIFDWLKTELVQITLTYCSQDRFRDNLQLNGDDRDFYNWNGLKYLLACYEEKIVSKRAKRTFNLQRILSGRKAVGEHLNDHLSIEHIWASKNKKEDFPENFYTKRRLGNFVLCGLSSNISLSDKGITEKVEHLLQDNAAGQGALDMLQVAELKTILEGATTEVKKSYSNRTKNYWRDIANKVAEKREDNLISFALERWRLPGEKKYQQKDKV